MSDGSLELAFRQRLAAAFSEQLGGRVYDLAHPPDAATPLVTYRFMGDRDSNDPAIQDATIQIQIKDGEYTAVKRLQNAIEAFMRGVRGEWLYPGECVWVHQVTALRRPDLYQPPTRMRIGVSEFTFKYATGE